MESDSVFLEKTYPQTILQFRYYRAFRDKGEKLAPDSEGKRHDQAHEDAHLEDEKAKNLQPKSTLILIDLKGQGLKVGCSRLQQNPIVLLDGRTGSKMSVCEYVQDCSRASFCLNCSLECVYELRLLLEKLGQKGEEGGSKK